LYESSFSINKAPTTLKDALNNYDIERANSKFGFEKDRDREATKVTAPQKVENFRNKNTCPVKQSPDQDSFSIPATPVPKGNQQNELDSSTKQSITSITSIVKTPFTRRKEGNFSSSTGQTAEQNFIQNASIQNLSYHQQRDSLPAQSGLKVKQEVIEGISRFQQSPFQANGKDRISPPQLQTNILTNRQCKQQVVTMSKTYQLSTAVPLNQVRAPSVLVTPINGNGFYEPPLNLTNSASIIAKQVDSIPPSRNSNSAVLMNPIQRIASSNGNFSSNVGNSEERPRTSRGKKAARNLQDVDSNVHQKRAIQIGTSNSNLAPLSKKIASYAANNPYHIKKLNI